MNPLVAMTLLACSTLPALAQTNVGVSIGINQPGVYGRIDIGSFPQPALIYSQPVIIVPQPVAVRAEPVYLYVPPGHQKNWAKHCGSYGACGQPVYFVRESWVRERYNEQQHGPEGKPGKKQGKQNKHQG